MALRDELGTITSVLDGAAAGYLNDSTEIRGLHGRADAVVLPESAEAAEWQRDPPLPAGLTGE